MIGRRWFVSFAAAIVAGGTVLAWGGAAQAAQVPPALAWSPTTSGTYDFGIVDGVGGKTPTQTFTLTNSGGSSTGTLAPVALTNTSGTAFSITSDRCSGLSLGPRKSCQVTVEYAPTTSGESDIATLTATGEHAAASITLTGQGGTPDLTLSPGTITVPPSYYGYGTKNYNYDFGHVSSGMTQTFTVTNSGTGSSNILQLAGLLPNTGFTLSNDHTSGSRVAPDGTSTFQLTFTAPAGCTGPTLVDTPLVVNTQDNGSPYISVLSTANCGTPITSVTATLDNLTSPYTGNPEFVAIGSGPYSPIGVGGTVHNVSVSPRLHGFTIQIPYSIAAKDSSNGQVVAGTLNCDTGYSYGGFPVPDACSVSNNVLTVTINIPTTYAGWYRGYTSLGTRYASVGSSLPTGVMCCAYVTWGKPLVTAAH
jgi:hypothetical protein